MTACKKCGGVDRYAGGHCKACHKSKMRAKYHHSDPEPKRAYQREWAAANPDKIHTDVRRQRSIDWRKSHPDSVRAAKARRRENASRGMDALDREMTIVWTAELRNAPCAYCGDPFEEVDHATPVSRGGTDHWYNLVSSCRSCNRRKMTRTWEEFTAS